jgi:hypothetical protein
MPSQLIIQICLPIVLIALAFLLKLVVDRQFNIADLILAGLELPVDISFFAISLLWHSRSPTPQMCPSACSHSRPTS